MKKKGKEKGEEMRVIDCDWKKRNGNGQSTCLLCNKLTWDSWCYDFELKILDKELLHTVLCDDCISKIKKELECKMTSNEKIIEDKPYMGLMTKNVVADTTKQEVKFDLCLMFGNEYKVYEIDTYNRIVCAKTKD